MRTRSRTGRAHRHFSTEVEASGPAGIGQDPVQRETRHPLEMADVARHELEAVMERRRGDLEIRVGQRPAALPQGRLDLPVDACESTLAEMTGTLLMRRAGREGGPLCARPPSGGRRTRS